MELKEGLAVWWWRQAKVQVQPEEKENIALVLYQRNKEEDSAETN